MAAVDGDGVDGLAGAALWGLIRAARTEYPGRVIRLVDVESDLESARPALEIAGEPEIAIRDGSPLVARLTRLSDRSVPTRPPDPDGTVLITGGTGGLGRRVARHLVVAHGVRHLLLTSRRGPDADLAGELESAGATSVRIVACDVSQRDAVADLLSTVDPNHPLTAVLHLAGVLDDALLPDQDADRIVRVMAPKVDGALHLHELTKDLDLAAFVLFSSAAGILGSPGQGNYAAANAYLDALAAHRRHRGLVGTSLAWGLWKPPGVGMTAGLGQAEISRMRRRGIVALSETQALRLLDAALSRSDAALVPVKLELAALDRELDNGAKLPALLRGLLRGRPRRAGDTAPSALRDRLSALTEAERSRLLVGIVRRESAVVLGESGEIGADQILREVGLDSLMAIDLSQRLATRTGLTLPATLAFDFSTPLAIAGLLLGQMFGVATPPPAKTVVTEAMPGSREDLFRFLDAKLGATS